MVRQSGRTRRLYIWSSAQGTHAKKLRGSCPGPQLKHSQKIFEAVPAVEAVPLDARCPSKRVALRQPA